MKLIPPLAHFAHNTRVGWALARHAVDVRSGLALVGLAASLTIKQRTRWRRSTIPVRIRIGGRPFRVMLGAHTDLEVLHEIVVRGEYDDAPKTNVRTIVDLGAHIGLATLRLLAANPHARVLAVEADPYLIDQLRANVAGFPVTVVNAAVTARPGPVSFYRSDVFSWGNSLQHTRPQQTLITVRGATLEELLLEAGLAQVDLLKVDIEGAEWDVLGEGVPSGVSAVVGEIHARTGHEPRALLSALSGLNVTVGRESPSELLFIATRTH